MNVSMYYYHAIEVLCNKRFRKYFNSFRSTMKHRHQKQIAKNFPIQHNGKQKKKWRFTNATAAAGIVVA